MTVAFMLSCVSRCDRGFYVDHQKDDNSTTFHTACMLLLAQVSMRAQDSLRAAGYPFWIAGLSLNGWGCLPSLQLQRGCRGGVRRPASLCLRQVNPGICLKR